MNVIAQRTLVTRHRVAFSAAALSTVLLVVANALPYELGGGKTISVDDVTFGPNGWYWSSQFALPILAFAATVAYALPRLRVSVSTALIAIGVGGYLLTLQDFGYLAAVAGDARPQRIGMTLMLLACATLAVVGLAGAAPAASQGSRRALATTAVVVGALFLVLGTVVPYDGSYAIFYGPQQHSVLDWYGVAPVGLAVLAVILATLGPSLGRRASGGLLATGTLGALSFAGYAAVPSSHGWGGAFIGLAGGVLIAAVGLGLIVVRPADAAQPEEWTVVTVTALDSARRRDALLRRQALARDLFLLAVAVPGILLLAYERSSGELAYFVAIGVLLAGTAIVEYAARRHHPTDLVFPSKALWQTADASLAAREARSMRTLVHPAERTRLLLALLAAAGAGALLFLLAVKAQSAGKALAAVVGGLAALLALIWWGQQVRKARLLGRSIRVSAETLPALQELLDEVRLTLQYFRPVDVYVVDKGVKPISMSSYLGTRVIVLEGSLVAGLDNPEVRQQLKFLIGRSLGALKAKHARIDLIVVLLQAVDMLKFVAPLLLPWYRATTYSGDQIGMVCCADVRAALHATRQLLVGKELAVEVSDGAILPQARLVQRRFLPRLAQLFSAEPHNTNRYANLLCFARYHDPALWVHLCETMSSEEVATLDRLWERSPYRRRAERRERQEAGAIAAEAVPSH